MGSYKWGYKFISPLIWATTTVALLTTAHELSSSESQSESSSKFFKGRVFGLVMVF